MERGEAERGARSEALRGKGKRPRVMFASQISTKYRAASPNIRANLLLSSSFNNFPCQLLWVVREKNGNGGASEYHDSLEYNPICVVLILKRLTAADAVPILAEMAVTAAMAT